MHNDPGSIEPNEPRRDSRRGPSASRLTRRAALLSAAAGAGLGAGVDRLLGGHSDRIAGAAANTPLVPFYGDHQAGVATPAQEELYFAAFDLVDSSAAGLRRLLRSWTEAAAALTAGRPYEPARRRPAVAPNDPGEAAGLPAARLTLTFGFGPSLFAAGRVRALAGRRPAALRRLPPFPGDQLDARRSGGDLCIQACADDPQVAFHAVHVLSLLASPAAVVRWTQAGFRRPAPQAGGDALPRNLIGFKDGTNNLRIDDPAELQRFVWVQPGDGPAWMTDGSYLIARRIEIEFSSWDRLSLAAQEQTIGRHKLSGAPLSPVPAHAHIRQAGPAANGGERILRRSYNFVSGSAGNGAAPSGELQGGLFFISFVRDPRRQFIPLQRRLAANDELAAFTLPTGSAIFACPPGARAGGFVGEGLFL